MNSALTDMWAIADQLASLDAQILCHAEAGQWDDADELMKKRDERIRAVAETADRNRLVSIIEAHQIFEKKLSSLQSQCGDELRTLRKSRAASNAYVQNQAAFR